jgi:hypothetical protein
MACSHFSSWSERGHDKVMGWGWTEGHQWWKQERRRLVDSSGRALARMDKGRSGWGLARG